MITKESSEFYSSMQRYVFVSPNCEINEQNNIPYDRCDYAIVDIDDVAGSTGIGTPLNEAGEEMVLWAILEPGETIEN